MATGHRLSSDDHNGVDADPTAGWQGFQCAWRRAVQRGRGLHVILDGVRRHPALFLGVVASTYVRRRRADRASAVERVVRVANAGDRRVPAGGGPGRGRRAVRTRGHVLQRSRASRRTTSKRTCGPTSRPHERPVRRESSPSRIATGLHSG